MKFPVYKRDGSKSNATVEIPDALLKGEPNEHAIWLAVRSEEAARRQGTHSTKTRSMVRGGGRKPFRQKGRGVARQGTIRSPLFPGGGIIFGPHPHTYSVKVPVKVKRIARISALMLKAQSEGIHIVEDFTMDAPKTSEMAALFSALGLADQKILMLTTEYDQVIARSVRNLARAKAQKAAAASTRELMDCTSIVLQKSAVEKLVGVLTHAA
jgi:large subunit ribosomal protein L4